MTLFAAILSALFIQAPASYSGTLFDQSGRALPDVPLSVTLTATQEKFETRTDAQGRFAFAALPPGRYRIDVAKPGFEQLVGPLELRDGERRTFDLTARLSGIAHSYRVLPNADPARAQRTVLRSTPPDDPCKGSAAAGCITPPMRLVEAWPVYPQAHAAKGVSANVEIKGKLGTDGLLKDLHAADPADPDFARAAIEALRLWEYSPVRLNGIAQEIPFSVTFRFIAGTD